MNQTELDKQMQDLGRERYQRRIAKARERGAESDTEYGTRLLAGAVDTVAEALGKELVKRGPSQRNTAINLLRDIKPHLAAMIALQSVLDCISRRKTASRTSVTIGRLIEDQIAFRKMEKEHPGLYKNVKHRTKRQPYRKARSEMSKAARVASTTLRVWSDRERLVVGHAMLELIRCETGLIEFITVKVSPRRSQTCVVATPETLQWIEKAVSRCELLRPYKLPMVKRPKDWDGPGTGGYNHGESIVKSWDTGSDLSWAIPETMPKVYEAINVLQRVPYTVNRQVYEVMRELWESGAQVAGLPPRNNEPVPPKPDDIATNEQARKLWRKMASLAYQANIALASQRLHQAQMMKMGEQFLDKSIWFPLTMDFRGRFYTEPNYLDYQGTDAAQALLSFAHKKPITEQGVNWLAVAGANHWGVKGTFKQRLEWVLKREAEIIRMGEDPKGWRDWAKADEPWQFLSFCIEWAAMRKVGPTYESGFMVSFDGSNNGLQVLSLAFRDEIGGASTNCVPNATPADIYEDVAARVRDLLKGNPHPYAKPWLDFGIDRSCTKRPTMVVPYSATRYSCCDYVVDWYNEKVKAGAPKLWPDPKLPCVWLTGIVWTAIDQTVVKAREAMRWFRASAAKMLEAEVDILWQTPTGFIVDQEYHSYKSCEVKARFGKTVRRFKLRDKAKKLDRRRHMNGLAANVVHSWDASALVYTVLAAREMGVSSLRVIHDSYACTPGEADALFKATRKAWTEMFTQDLVTDLHAQWSARLPSGFELPPPPSKGTLDLTRLKDAHYFFA